MTLLRFDPIEEARKYLFVRERADKANYGNRVEGIQRWALGQPGQSWCGYFAIGFVLDVCFQGDSPFPRTAAMNGETTAALEYARRQGWVREIPERGDLVFSVHPDGTAHHVGFFVEAVPETDRIITIAGNTDATGTSSNGDRVGEHAVARAGKVFVHYPRA